MAQRPPPPGEPGGNADEPRPPISLPARYRFEASLGEGGLGTVVKAYDTQLRTHVAIKTICHARSTQNPWEYDALRDRFEREAIAGAQPAVRNSPYVVTVYDLVIDNAGNAFLVLEYVPGGTLRDRLVGGPLPPDAALRLTADAARGLMALHEADLVHRDIKPENIFVAADGHAKVGDLGIVQMGTTTFRTRLAYGSDRGHPGTPLYMGPEQANTTDFLTAEADQFSLGAVLFELVTGKRLKQIYARERGAVLAGLPPGLAGLIGRMTTEDPADRYPGMGALLDAIAQVDLSAPPAVSPDPPSPPPPLPTPTDPWTTPQPALAPTWVEPAAPPIPYQPPPGAPPPAGRVSRRAMLVGIGGVAVAGGAAGVWAVRRDGSAGEGAPTATTVSTRIAAATVAATSVAATPTSAPQSAPTATTAPVATPTSIPATATNIAPTATASPSGATAADPLCRGKAVGCSVWRSPRTDRRSPRGRVTRPYGSGCCHRDHVLQYTSANGASLRYT